MVVEEPAQHLREDSRAGTLEAPDAERSDRARGEGVHVRLRGGDPGPDRVRVPEQHLAGLGQRHRLLASRPLDELLADDPLERGDLLADGGLRVAERGRGAAERRAGRDSLERSEMP